MRKKQIIIIVSLFIVLGLPVAGIACESGRGKAGCICPAVAGERISKCEQQSIAACILKQRGERNLTDEKTPQLKSLKNTVEKKLIQDEAEMKVLRIELYDLVRQDKVDLKAVDTKIEKMGELYTKIKKDYIYAKLDAEKILTGEQRDKFRKHREMEGEE